VFIGLPEIVEYFAGEFALLYVLHFYKGVCLLVNHEGAFDSNLFLNESVEAFFDHVLGGVLVEVPEQDLELVSFFVHGLLLYDEDPIRLNITCS
jgi:hypothetical protein